MEEVNDCVRSTHRCIHIHYIHNKHSGVYSKTDTQTTFILELLSELGHNSESYYWIFTSKSTDTILRAVSDVVVCATAPFDATWPVQVEDQRSSTVVVCSDVFFKITWIDFNCFRGYFQIAAYQSNFGI